MFWEHGGHSDLGNIFYTLKKINLISRLPANYTSNIKKIDYFQNFLEEASEIENSLYTAELEKRMVYMPSQKSE